MGITIIKDNIVKRVCIGKKNKSVILYLPWQEFIFISSLSRASSLLIRLQTKQNGDAALELRKKKKEMVWRDVIGRW
jgi:hypothetical protein